MFYIYSYLSDSPSPLHHAYTCLASKISLKRYCSIPASFKRRYILWKGSHMFHSKECNKLLQYIRIHQQALAGLSNTRSCTDGYQAGVVWINKCRDGTGGGERVGGICKCGMHLPIVCIVFHMFAFVCLTLHFCMPLGSPRPHFMSLQAQPANIKKELVSILYIWHLKLEHFECLMKQELEELLLTWSLFVIFSRFKGIKGHLDHEMELRETAINEQI